MFARRFSLPPVNEAKYEPRQIPNARPDMEGTAIFHPPREMWLTLLGEMVQMVNEAVRRRAGTVRDASKPLSLEVCRSNRDKIALLHPHPLGSTVLQYMADRLDVDDPLFGYLAMSRAEGWLQGFITATTFTTWHASFRWDSKNPVLDLLDHAPEDGDTPEGQTPWIPKVDADASLSTELQAELRAGDPENEGVVWPRVAELSLLGALGCGRWLVELVIEELEAEGSP